MTTGRDGGDAPWAAVNSGVIRSPIGDEHLGTATLEPKGAFEAGSFSESEQPPRKSGTTSIAAASLKYSARVIAVELHDSGADRSLAAVEHADGS